MKATDEAFAEVTQSAAKVAELVGEIAAASASEQLSAQSETMQGFVGDLVDMVGSGKGGRQAGLGDKARAVLRRSPRALPSPAAQKPRTAGNKRDPRPAILMDDVDFKDF